MSILVRFSPKSVTAEKYDQTMRTLEEKGLWPTDGVDYHVCFGTDGDLLVSEIWDCQSSSLRSVRSSCRCSRKPGSRSMESRRSSMFTTPTSARRVAAHRAGTGRAAEESLGVQESGWAALGIPVGAGPE